MLQFIFATRNKPSSTTLIEIREGKMPYPPEAVANHFLDLATEENETLDPMKIQKLVYFAHGWHLALFDQSLISDYVEAWKFGPVISDLYHAFKKFGNEPITEKATRFDGVNKRPFIPTVASADKRTKEHIKTVWDGHKNFTGIQLSNLTHQPGTPWHKVWFKSDNRASSIIPDELIKDYFKNYRG